MTVLNARLVYTRYGSPVVALRRFDARTFPSRSTILPRTTFRAAAITAGLSGARERSGDRSTCQYPAPRAIPANATISASPTWPIVWPSGFGRAGDRCAPLMARRHRLRSVPAAAGPVPAAAGPARLRAAAGGAPTAAPDRSAGRGEGRGG